MRTRVGDRSNSRSPPMSLPLDTRRPAARLIAATGCISKRVTRIEPSAVTDLSGRWNDTDSRLVANQLVEQTLAAGWAKPYTDLHGGEAPTVIVGTFANRTMEHIAVGTFVKDVERALITTGAARVVASGDQRTEMRGAR